LGFSINEKLDLLTNSVVREMRKIQEEARTALKKAQKEIK